MIELTVERIETELGCVQEAGKKHGGYTPWERIYAQHVEFLLSQLATITEERDKLKLQLAGRTYCHSDEQINKDLVAAEEALDKMMTLNDKLTEWEDISTAPKDGTEILTYSKPWGVKQLCWKPIVYPKGSNGDKLPEHRKGAWVQFNADPRQIGCFNPTDEITHWKHIPKFKATK